MSKKNILETLISLMAQAVFLLIVFFMFPGMAVLATMKSLSGIKLDIGQMWTFAAIVSAVLLVIFYFLKEKDFMDAAGMHLLVGVGVLSFYLIASFGFKAEFPSQHVNFFFEGEPSPRQEVYKSENVSRSLEQSFPSPIQENAVVQEANEETPLAELTTAPADLQQEKAIDDIEVVGIFQGVTWGDYGHLELIDEQGKEYSFWLLNSIEGEQVADDPNVDSYIGRRCRVRYRKEKKFIPEANEEMEVETLVRFDWIIEEQSDMSQATSEE